MPILLLAVVSALAGLLDHAALRVAGAGEGRDGSRRRRRGGGRRGARMGRLVAGADGSERRHRPRALGRPGDDGRGRFRASRCWPTSSGTTRPSSRSTRASPSWGNDNATQLSTRLLTWVTDLGDWPIVPLLVRPDPDLRAAPRSESLPRARSCFVVFVGDKLVTNGIKDLVDRARPTLNPIAETLGPSFPSGHSSTAASFYAALALILARRRGARALARCSRGAPARSPSRSRRVACCSTSTGSRTSSRGSCSAGPGSRSAPSPSAAVGCTSPSRWSGRPRMPRSAARKDAIATRRPAKV